MEHTDPVETKKGDTLIGKILSAIEKKDKDLLTSSLKELNQKLTGGSLAHFQNEKVLSDEVDRILKAIDGNNTETVNLGDGGYSRLHVGIYLEKPDVSISNSSREEVKIKWGELQTEYNQAK